MTWIRSHTCNESVFSWPLCSSEERSTSLYNSAASRNSSARCKGKANAQCQWICPSHVELRGSKQHCVFNAWNQQSTSVQKRVRRHKDKIMSCDFFKLIPMGKCELERKCRSGDLYFWWCGFQPGRWVRTLIVCELLHTPLDISSAGTWGAPPSSWCWGGEVWKDT